ncbi:dethiobiotin synthase [Skermania piniformis]|uniref:ATP-dependent dethiobiotin synthetase BioD n=1 Tax=Skermania pinensis TaxID=39122 RepID=A0ABX8SB97_9ACTN|nr:dethiobiotin synthase [Skermania piniformis]QXQ15130.1 dethiobiotin synthase [Skermania piniformis]
MRFIFVTGTSTGVGKTVVTAALAATARSSGRAVVVCKPAQTGVAEGEPGDIHEVERLTGVGGIELARFPDPLAPDTAARVAGLAPLGLYEAECALRGLPGDVVLVEGAGGLLVGLGEDGFTLLDLATRLGGAVVVVADAGLGTLNHSALTVRELQASGVSCAGLVIGSWPRKPDLAMLCNLEDLPRVTGVPIVGRVPAGAGSLQRERFVAEAPTWFTSDSLSR